MARDVRVAYYSPLPPERSGIADYSALLLPALARRFDVHVVKRGRTRPPRGTDLSLYHVGNSPDAHGWILDALRGRPGLVVLHDFVLHHLVAGTTLGKGDSDAYLRAMERDAGLPGRLLAYGVMDGSLPPLWTVRPEDFPLAREVLDLAAGHGLVVHSDYVRGRAREAGFAGPIWRIPMPAWPEPRVEPERVEGDPLVGSFGFLNANKRIPQLLEAFALLRKRRPAARLLLVGPEAPGLDLERRLERLGLQDAVERHGFVAEDRFWALVAACDVCVSLRFPTMGETSAGAIRVLTLAKPLVVSDADAFRELPDDVAAKVAPGEDEVESLAALLLLLAESPERRAEMRDAARAYVSREHELEHVADLYAAAVEEASGGEAVREAVLREVAGAAADVGIDDAPAIARSLEEIGLGR